MKLCKCGCGQEVLSETAKYISGHNSRGKIVSKETIQKIKLSLSNRSVDEIQNSNNKRKTTNIQKYGVDTPTKSEIIKKKIKETIFNKYGVFYASQNSIIKDKVKNTLLDRYNVTSPLQYKKFQEKSIATCLKNYGVEYSQQSKEVQEKSKKTNLEKLGVEFPQQSKEVQEKSKKTNLEKLGVEFPQQSKEVQERTKQTNKNRYGEEYIYQSKKVKEKSKKTCLIRYGVDNFSKTSKGRQISRENYIRLIENQKLNGEPLTPRIGNLERDCLNELQNYTNYQIQRNIHLIGYFPDGYISELKLIIEFDERWHNFTFFKNKDIKKNQDYKDNNFNLFRIQEIDWLKNKEQVILNFMKLISVTNSCS